MSDIQTARFGKYVQKLFNLKQLMTLGEAMPDVMPTIDLEQPRPEGEIFLGNDLACGVVGVTGAVGQLGNVGLINPTGSGILVVLDSVSVHVSVAQNIYAAYDGVIGAYSPSSQKMFKDSRRTFAAGGTSIPTAQLIPRDAINVGSIYGTHAYHWAPALTTVYFPECTGIVLPPGYGHLLRCETTNTGLNVNYAWRERRVEAAELTAG